MFGIAGVKRRKGLYRALLLRSMSDLRSRGRETKCYLEGELEINYLTSDIRWLTRNLFFTVETSRLTPPPPKKKKSHATLNVQTSLGVLNFFLDG